MQDIYVDTVSAINFNNGVVRILMVDQDPQTLAESAKTGTDTAPRVREKQQVIMPLGGFLYMASVIKGLLDDPKMQEVIARHVAAGLLPGAEPAAAPVTAPVTATAAE